MSPVPSVPRPDEWHGPEPVYALLGPVVGGVARLLFRLDIEGLVNVPTRGPALIVAQHVSHLDPLVVFSLCRRAGRRPRFLALADLWRRPVLGWLLDRGHMIPVFRGREDGAERMITAACGALERDQVVVVYPEGRLPQPGAAQQPQRGAGRLMLASRAPVVPVAMIGVPAWSGRLPGLRRRVTVRVGAPLELDDLRGGGGDASRGDERTAAQRALDAFERLG